MKSLLLSAVTFLAILPAYAQEDAAVPVAIDIEKVDIAPVEPFPEGFRSLFFTGEEQAALTTALARKLPAAPVMDAPAPSQSLVPAEAQNAPPPPRILHLSGIVYAKEGEWSIWLNGRQITPVSKPDEIRELIVGRESVSLKWYDAQTQAVVPVRLRPQQRFNIDTKTFMPGTLDVPVVAPDPAASALTP